MERKIPEVIQPVLTDYTRRMEQLLPGLMTGFYLHGSIALEAFNPRWSDLDFITVVSRKPGPREMDCLRLIHQAIRVTCPRWELEGIYLESGDLGRFPNEIAPCPCYYDGALHARGYRNLNSVTWWILKNRGIAVVGPPPQELDFVVDWDRLIAEMKENLNTYWAAWARKPVQQVKLLTDWGIQWVVLGVLRQFYTFRENDITSKLAAGKYALAHLPTKWHRLIQEALDIREGTHESHHNFRIVRAIEAVRFLNYIIESCNAQFN